MSGIFGILGLPDSDRSFVNTIGQQTVYDAVQMYLQKVNTDMMQALSVFLEEETENHKERYYLPGGGRLQRRGEASSVGAVKATGSWDTAYPLEDFGAQLAGDDVSLAYMTMGQLDRHIDTIVIQDINTVRFEMLYALFHGDQRTFVDPIWGSLTVQPLADGDTTVYPPVLGSESEATDNHYLESNYAATAISDTNNPYVTMREELEEHFGTSTGGEEIAVFINPAETPETEDLTDFDAVPDNFIRVGANTDVPVNLPGVPGRILGRTNGVWVVEWRWIPSGWALGVHLGQKPPLKMRVDPADTGLPRGLTLVGRDTQFPMESAFYRHRFGLGVGNRLNGVVMEFGTGGTYTAPTAYA